MPLCQQAQYSTTPQTAPRRTPRALMAMMVMRMGSKVFSTLPRFLEMFSSPSPKPSYPGVLPREKNKIGSMSTANISDGSRQKNREKDRKGRKSHVYFACARPRACGSSLKWGLAPSMLGNSQVCVWLIVGNGGVEGEGAGTRSASLAHGNNQFWVNSGVYLLM